LIISGEVCLIAWLADCIADRLVKRSGPETHRQDHPVFAANITSSKKSGKSLRPPI